MYELDYTAENCIEQNGQLDIELIGLRHFRQHHLWSTTVVDYRKQFLFVMNIIV